MAVARHLAIDRRIIRLANENEALSDDIGKLEDVLRLHHTLVSERQNSVKNLIREEVGGSVWRHGGKGKMKNYKNKKDLREGRDAPVAAPRVNSGVRPKSSRQNADHAPTIVLNQKSVSVNHAQPELDAGDTDTLDLVPQRDVPTDTKKGPTHMPPKRPVSSRKITPDDVQIEPKTSSSDRAPRPSSRAVSRHFRSLSARGSRRKPIADQNAPDIDGVQGQAVDISTKFVTSVSDSEEERLSSRNNKDKDKSYEEKISNLKQKVINKVLSQPDVEKKLKVFKKPHTESDSGRLASQRKRDSESSGEKDISPKTSGRSTEESTSKTSIESVPSGAPDLSRSNSLELDTWIMDLHLKDPCKYREILKQNDITPKILLTMTDLDLKRIGIENSIVLSKIKKGLAKLKTAQSKQKESKSKSTEQGKTQSSRFKISLEDLNKEVNNAEKVQETEKNQNKSKKLEDKIDSQDSHEEAKEVDVKDESNSSKSGQKAAWGAGPGVRSASSAISLKSRPSSAGSKVRLRPGSAKPVKPGILRKGLSRPQSAWAQGKRPEPKNGEDSTSSARSQGRKSVRENLDVSGDDGQSMLTVTGANLGSPGRSQLVASVNGRDSDSKGSDTISSRASTARIAIETMESQIAILQKEASLTGDAATMSLISQLQGQLAQIQQAVTSETLDESDSSSFSTKDTPPAPPAAAGNLVTAALHGNVRPMAFKHPAVGDDDDVDGQQLYGDEELGVVPPGAGPPGPASQVGLSPSARRSSSLTGGGAGRSSSSRPSPPGVLNMSMSKQAILKQVRKQKEEHRRTVRHLESELARLKHKDPLRNSEVPEDEIEYSELDLIGEGAFSQVFSGMFQGTQVAVKRLKVPLGSQDKNYFIAEVNLLRELRHPRVVLLMGVCTVAYLPLMVLEFMDGGSLYDYLHDDNCPSLDHAAYYQIAQDIAVGMNYLHRHRPPVLHMDLKSMNVLLQSNLRAKIADFGFSKLRHDAEVAGSQRGGTGGGGGGKMKGTPAWMAPELLTGTGDISSKADVYSYGIILWEMITRRRPYQGCSMYQVIERVRNNKRPDLPDDCPKGLCAVVTACWEQHPQRRPAFQEVLHYLEELHLPPEWKSLFAAAGLPKVALDDIEATRSLIDIVSQTVQTGQLPTMRPPTPTTDNRELILDEPPRPKLTLEESVVQGKQKGVVSNVKTINKGKILKPNNKCVSDNKKSDNLPPAHVLAPPPAPPPPPPPPVPPPGTHGGHANKQQAPPAPPPPVPPTKPTTTTTNQNFMDALKAGLKDVKLRPTIPNDKPTNSEAKPTLGNKSMVNGATGGGRGSGTGGGGTGSKAAGVFAPGAAELINQRSRLRPTVQPNPGQLEDLSKVSEGTITGLAEVLKKAVSDRRTAINAGVKSIDMSQQSYIDSGWSID